MVHHHLRRNLRHVVQQARGEELDARTDLFSFGAVLYEMTTGRQAFSGDSAAVIHDAILNRMPTSALRLNPELPPTLEEIINKALEKNRDVRYQHGSEMRADLKRLKRETESGRGAPAETPAAAVRELVLRKRIWLVAVTSMAVIAISPLAFMLTRPARAPKVSGFSRITHDERLKFLVCTDGSRLYLNEWASGWIISQVSSSGGEVSTIPKPSPKMVLLGVSPDGANLLVADRPAALFKGPLWSLPVLGDSPRRLGETVGQEAVWSHDGQVLAYANGRDLFLAKADGTESQKLRTMPFGIGGPVWSPDGRVIRFNMHSGLWEISIDGTNLHQLFPGWHQPPAECCGKWTADGRYYVFQSKNSIWAVAEANTRLRRASNQPVQLTSGPMNVSQPLPSGDGKKLYVLGGLARGELTRYDRKTGQFVPFLSGISADGMSFSQDGKWVAYVAYPEGTLWRSRADGSDRRQLSFPPSLYSAGFPRWSPDGRQIVFYASSAGQLPRIYQVSPDGTSAPEPILGSRYGQWYPDWSPDGKAIVFSGNYNDFESMIRIVDLTTRQILDVPASKGLTTPKWSPDGHYILAIRANLQGAALFDLTTQTWAELVGETVTFPRWAKDGQYVYFLHWPDEPSVMRVRIRDRKLERVADLGNFRQTGFYTMSLALAPDDSPLLLRDTGTQEVYALNVDFP